MNLKFPIKTWQQFWALDISGCQQLNREWLYGLSSGPELVMLYPSTERYLFKLIFKHNSVITFLWRLNYRPFSRNILL